MKRKRILQFGFRSGKPDAAIPVIDCRVIPNPYALKDPVKIRQAVHNHPHFAALVQQGIELLNDHDVIAVGCEFGVHRSGLVAKEIWVTTDHDVDIEKFSV